MGVGGRYGCFRRSGVGLFGVGLIVRCFGYIGGTRLGYIVVSIFI